MTEILGAEASKPRPLPCKGSILSLQHSFSNHAPPSEKADFSKAIMVNT
jgi:hypothetical protein